MITSATRSIHVSGAFRGLLLCGLAIPLCLGGVAGTAVAGDLLRGGTYGGARAGSAIPGSFTPPSALQAKQNAADILARTTQAIQAVRSAQSAARAIAAARGNNLGIPNPNKPALNLPAVTEGLSTNGLYPVGGISSLPSGWTGVKSLSQSQSGGATTVTVLQNAPDANLTWQSFNVGRKTTLDFDQSAGGADESKWIAFNFVQNNSINPSQILGSIHAGGQVYVIDQNGIIFGGASQVNAHALVASALPLNTNLVSRGLLNNPDAQFLFSALPIAAGPNGTPAFTPPAAPASGEYGDVIVESGATMFSPASSSKVGGRIALIGANVTNDGQISTPDGQTILAAGLQVGFVAHPSGDPSLRGLDVYVGAIAASPLSIPYAGTATNNGLIEVPEGDVTITGKTVNQFGGIDSSTSVSLNGRIDLLADYNSVSSPTPTSGISSAGQSTGGIRNLSPFAFLPGSAGLVELGPGSVTDILPEVNSSATVVPAQTLAPASVNIQGEVIHMAAGSTILAPSAAINLDAGQWVLRNLSNGAQTKFVNSEGQIYMDSGAEIDSAGSVDVPASVTDNIVAAQLRGSELEDDPLQRFGVLRGQTIDFDIREQGTYDGAAWIGSPIANLFAYANLVEQTIGELTVNGGKVTMNAGGSIVMQRGSSIDVSGGYINYAAGVVTTTQVISGGHIYDISQATPDMIYQGIFTGQFTVSADKYGLSETYTDPLLKGSHYEDGYVYGGNAGEILITAPSVALDGALLGATAAGPRQLTLGPVPAALSLSFQGQSATAPNFLAIPPAISPNVLIDPDVALPPAAPFALDGSGNPLPLSTKRQSEVVLSPDLMSQDGFGIVTIDNGGGNITVPAGVSLKGPAVTFADPSAASGEATASLTLEGANIDVEGSITIPGGAVTLTAYDINPDTLLALQAGGAIRSPSPVAGVGGVVLGSNASIDTSGLIVDNREGAPAPETLPLVTNGGSVTIDSFSANLKPGSVINVSGGLEITPARQFKFGNAGSIMVETGADPEIDSVIGGRLDLGSTLEGYAGLGAAGGSLLVQAQLVQIGGETSNPPTLVLPDTFFDQGGFQRFTIEGLGGSNSAGKAVPAVLIAPGANISPVVTSEIAVQDPARPNTVELMPELFPVGSRPAASLSFKAPGVTDLFDGSILVERGDVVMGTGAQVTTDPGGSVSFSGNTVAILGSVVVPAGTISVSAKNNSALLLSHPSTAEIDLVLGPESLLSTAGTTVDTPNAYGYNTGYVLPGGAITVSGNILAERGAVLDVSGATGVFDLAPTYSSLQNPETAPVSGPALVPTRIDSNGGSLTLIGDQELFTDATLRGNAGGPSAVGGTLTVESGHFYALNSNQVKLPTDITITVTQGGPVIPTNFTASGVAAIGQVVDSNGGTEISGGNFAVNAFEGGGFDNLVLPGAVEFKGSVSIDAPGSVLVGTGGVIAGDGNKSSIEIKASYVALGTPFEPPQPGAPEVVALSNGYAPPTYGPANLTVTAGLIDIGNLSLQGIGKASFIADGGDIRGDGSLDVAGDIYMRAGQIYPPTETVFNIVASDYSSGGSNQGGSITIVGSGTRQLPLSAGGTLNLFASVINQGGTLRAPMGTINLGWDGQGTGYVDPLSGETVPVAKEITLENGSVTSVAAVDPATGQGILIPYGINLNDKQWIDPSGTDITAGGAPAKKITISGVSVDDQKGALIDLRGGGDLFAYEFVPGLGGSADILASTSSFAIIPGYQAGYAPYAPYFNGGSSGPVAGAATSNLGGDPGYVNSKLQIGSEVYLNGVDGLAAGLYTLLPARYALLPGAFLVTPESGVPVGTAQAPDGSFMTTGYRFNGLSSQSAQPLFSVFEVQSQAVVNARAQYVGFMGSSFLQQGAIDNHLAVPRLPGDAGQLVLEAAQAMTIDGQLDSSTPAGGLQSLVDISSPVAIEIAKQGAGNGSGGLVLDASALSAFGAGSLLIGGIRETGADGTIVTVTTPDITVDGGAHLAGSDLILAAKTDITVSSGAEIESIGAASDSDPSLTVNGNGVLLRVSGDVAGTESRTIDPNSPNNAILSIQAGAELTGASITIDSSASVNLDPAAVLHAGSLSLASGKIIVELNNPGTVPVTPGDLVLTENALQGFQAGATSLSLLSYSTLDFYGTGAIGALSTTNQPLLKNLTMDAGEIRGFNNGGGAVALSARNVSLGNSGNGADPGAAAGLAGELDINASVIDLGAQALNIDQFSTVKLTAAGGILATTKGNLSADGAITLTTPLVTGIKGASETISAAGALQIAGSKGPATVAGGLGASLTFTGATIDDNGDVSAPSGSLTFHAVSGDITIGDQSAATISAGGASRTFFDLTKYTNGGAITLMADLGSITISQGSTVSVAAQAGGGDAGTLAVSAPGGTFTLLGALAGQAGAGGNGGSFSMDVSTLPLDAASLPDLGPIDLSLNQAGFTNGLSFRVRNSNVTIAGVANAETFTVSADSGSVDILGTINASSDSGNFGGSINVFASGDVTLESAGVLNASAIDYNDAGKGGAISLETAGGMITINGNIDLGVTNAPSGPGAAQDVTGTLYLRAPQNDGFGNVLVANADPTSGAGVNVAPIAGSINGASSIVVEGHYIQSVNAPTANIDDYEGTALTNASVFMANASTISSSVAGATGLAIEVRPGEEIDNTGGDLVLQSDWDLAPARFGPNADPNVPGSGIAGTLTLRAAGNVIFNGALSDGFDVTQSPDGSLWQAPLLAAGSESWSYRITSGADFSSVNYSAVAPKSQLPAGGASVEIGLDNGLSIATDGANATTSEVIQGFFQVIRTGVGNINVSAGGDIQLLNQFATIYTAGTQVADPTMGGTFDVPILNPSANGGNPLGAAQETPEYPAQYSYGGGDVSIYAQGDISHLTLDNLDNLIPDSEKELPVNWLYRRGYVNSSGMFGRGKNGDIASTTWWVDFSNFFEGVGALGGGNVSMIAGGSINNVDAVIPTNARMPQGAPNAAAMVELGGGDLVLRSGADINGGVYYVERGQGILNAGGSITTNSTRSASLGAIVAPASINDPGTWLPTTLFLGTGGFEVSANDDLLLGPVSNPFLLPEGYSNTFWDKTYFSTYGAGDFVDVSSLTGDVTLRQSASLPALAATPQPLLYIWLNNVLLLNTTRGQESLSDFQPWLRLDESSVEAFQNTVSILPPALRVTAFSANIDIAGNLTLAPSSQGTLQLAAAESINGLQPDGFIANANLEAWASSEIDVSDADPNRLPQATSPFAYQSLVGTPRTSYDSGTDFLQFIANLFDETGSTVGTAAVLQTQQTLHAAGILHASDDSPVQVYADQGNISGFTLFSPKPARIVAGTDISDIAFYIQNTGAGSLSIVSAGRDIIPYDANAPLLVQAESSGNTLALTQGALPGDIQVSGPGTLEVLAGHNLTLGESTPNSDPSIGLGITTIGNGRNPSLPFAGASIIAMAGVGGVADGLSGANMLDFKGFESQFLGSALGAQYFSDLSQTDPSLDITSFADFEKLSPEDQDMAALELFFIVLRDAGREHNVPGSTGFGNYTLGDEAIATLLSGATPSGDIDLTSREIKTESGGDINLLALGGQLTVGVNTVGSSVDQGILTQDGGNISIYTDGNVTVGTSRIFTLRGGNEIIWSTAGNIAAGAAAKTVQSAPPTRVLVDPQSGDIQTDLAGLATGGGIGVLATVEGVPPGSVDLIAPVGVIDAGDAGIRATGNLNLAATQVLNASNISAAGSSAGVPAVTVAAPNLGAINASSAATGAASNATAQANGQNAPQTGGDDVPSIIDVQVVGYGGGDSDM